MKQLMNFILILTLIISGIVINQVESKEKKNYIKVVYFHSDYRCATCKKLEAYSKETVKEFFTKELKSGSIIWEVINFSREENEHYIDDFQLYNQALIIMKYENGKLKEWKNLTKIWEFVGDKTDYFKYVKKEINKYQKG